MAVANPIGRVNYEPNSWDGGAGGPREDPDAGFRSYDPSAEPGAVGPEGPQGPVGETGPEGPPGTGGIGAVLVVTAQGGEGEFADANCPKQAPLAIGGGGSVEDKGGLLEISAPITEHELSGDGQQPSGWRVRSEGGHYTAYAICTGAAATGSPEDPEKEAAEEKEAAPKK